MSRKKQNTERSLKAREINYGLYGVNIYGSGLKTIKEQFKQQVRTGLRQTVFLIDLEDIQEELNQQSRNSKQRQELLSNFNMHLINIILQQIQKYLKDYDWLIKKINEELKFNLYEYWLKPSEESKPSITANKPKEKATKNTKKSTSLIATQEINKPCSSQTVIVKEHNRVGQVEQYSKRKYIKDEPIREKLFIIIMGQMDEHFYMDLLRRNQPLEGIINFIPTESNYDLMLGNNILKDFILQTQESINTSIYAIRQERNFKPTGLFLYNLPIISTCLATKYMREIFDQLTWTVYDIEMLRQQYELYYYRPFRITNVAIPAYVDLKEYYHLAETLNMQDPYQQNNLPKCGLDLATIATYLNSLLNACSDLPQDIMEDHELQNSSFENSFSSVTKINKLEKLVVDENNQLLVNMLQYTTQSRFQSVYDCCLDYNIFKEYLLSSQTFLKNSTSNSVEDTSISDMLCLLLPPFVKYYANADSSSQRLCQLIEEYDDYRLDEIEVGCKLFTFEKQFNVLTEKQGVVIIPTRLCFRDFTLFQMSEFLENLKLPQQLETSLLNKNGALMELNDNIFIRLNSLKALKLFKDFQQQEAISNSKNVNRLSRNKLEKKSSVTKSTVTLDYKEGLPPDHHLLKGYNLEDILQEVKFKTSKYNYSHGYVQLYEEKWCFQDMNKQLTLNINETSIVLNRPRHQLRGLSNSIRLVTRNDINIRILNEPQENAKIIMNYPNGLSVSYHENFCSQNWTCDQTPADEQHRIYTPYGCIILFYKANDMILVMRYNGEIYQLLQHELLEEEDEQTLNTESLDSFQQQSSGLFDLKAQGDALYLNENYKRRESNPSNKIQTIGDSLERNKKSRTKSHLKNQRRLAKYKSGAYLKNVIENEIKYLDSITASYGLKYLHLTLTTTQGRRFNINNKGKIVESPGCRIKEWRDYFANEDYCERSDGVKMIWTKECFKCYHMDGTLFTTTSEETFVKAYMDDFDSQISQSSSHCGQEGNCEEQQPATSEDRQQQSFATLKEQPNYTEFLTNEAAEEHVPEDTRYVCYTCSNWLMQHSAYAGIHMITSVLYPSLQPLEMKVFAVDNIRFYIQAEAILRSCTNNFTESETEIITENEEEQEYVETNQVINVWIDDSLNVKAYEEFCEIRAELSPPYAEADGGCDADKISESESLTLRLKYSDWINDAFKYLIDEIASLRECNESNIKELYFIEKTNENAITRGFEFLTLLPLNSVYNCRMSNNTIELKAIKTINELMTNNLVLHKQDMKKFPRFKRQPCKKTITPDDYAPYVFSSNIFVKIPRSLRSVEHITKFLEPFENENFKNLRNKFKNVLNLNFNSKLQMDLKNYRSAYNWKKYRWQHERRLFLEQQRLGLYYAMSRYKIFPGYWKFTKEYNSQVRNIEFFEFVQNKCESKRRTSN